jgi:DNA-binding transcriptional LysR family regulator
MNLKQIEAFRAVMVAGSMTSAAKDLHTSQPNISRLISQLEGDIGLTLFERAGVRLIPTTEGNAFYREVERAYVGLEGLSHSAAQIRTLGSGRLRIAAVPSVGMTLMPRAIQRFQEAHPGVTVSLHVNTSGTVNHWTASQFCDVGVAVYSSEASTCETEFLASHAAYAVLPEGHRLARRASLTAQDFEGEHFVSLCNGDGTRTLMDDLFAREGVTRILGAEAQYAAICCEMVRMGMGVTLAHLIVARDFAGRGVVIRPFKPEVRFPLYLLYPSKLPKDRLTLAFVAILRAVLAETVAEAKKLTKR